MILHTETSLGRSCSSASPKAFHFTAKTLLIDSHFLEILLIISHISTSKQDNVAEWLTRLVAIQIPSGAQVRILPLSFSFGWVTSFWLKRSECGRWMALGCCASLHCDSPKKYDSDFLTLGCAGRIVAFGSAAKLEAGSRGCTRGS